MNLLLRSQHMNSGCSLIQSYSAIWLCCDSSGPAIVQMWNWTTCYNPNRWILFTLWFKITLQYYIVVILQVLHFQVQMWNWISCYNPNTWILFALWFKITLQYDIVVILQVLHFQVQMLNWTSCYNPNIQILFVFWIKITLQYDIVGDT